MEQVRLQPEAGLTGATTTDNKNILIPSGFGIGRPVIHGQTFCLREDDVIFKHRINIGLDVLCCTPPGRTILQILTELLGILTLHIDSQSNRGCNGDADAEIDWMEAGRDGCESCHQALHEVHDFTGQI